MVQIWFPGLRFNGLRIDKGQLLDVNLLSVQLSIPPWDMQIIPAITFWEPFLIFDGDWIVSALSGWLTAMPKWVWDFAKTAVDSWADAFYKAHSTYEEYIREKESAKQKE